MYFLRKNFSDIELMDGIRAGENERRFAENNLYDKYIHLIRDALRKRKLD